MNKRIKRLISAACAAALVFGLVPVNAEAEVELNWNFVTVFEPDEEGREIRRLAEEELYAAGRMPHGMPDWSSDIYEIDGGFRIRSGSGGGFRQVMGMSSMAFNYITLPTDANFRISGTMRIEQTFANAPSHQFSGFIVKDAWEDHVWSEQMSEFIGPENVGLAMVWAGISPAEQAGWAQSRILAARTHADIRSFPEMSTTLSYNLPVGYEYHVELWRIGNTYVSIVNGHAETRDAAIDWRGGHIYVGMMANRGHITEFTNVNVELLGDDFSTLTGYEIDFSAVEAVERLEGDLPVFGTSRFVPDLSGMVLRVNGEQMPRGTFGVEPVSVARASIGGIPAEGRIFWNGGVINFSYLVEAAAMPGAEPTPPPAPTPVPADETNGETAPVLLPAEEPNGIAGFPVVIIAAAAVAAVAVIVVIVAVIAKRK